MLKHSIKNVLTVTFTFIFLLSANFCFSYDVLISSEDSYVEEEFYDEEELNENLLGNGCNEYDWFMHGLFDAASSTWEICYNAEEEYSDTIHFSITAGSSSFFLCYLYFTIVQDGKQFDVSKYKLYERDALIYFYDFDGCSDVKEGVTVTGKIYWFPDWFDIFSPFRIYYLDDYLDVDGAPIPETTTTTTLITTSTTTTPEPSTTTIPVTSTTSTTSIETTTTTTIDYDISGLHSTTWRSTIQEYYIGFYDGAYYYSTDGISWSFGPGSMMYVDFNGMYIAFYNPVTLIAATYILEVGIYYTTESSGTLINLGVYLLFGTPIPYGYNMTLHSTNWIPPEKTGELNQQIIDGTEVFFKNISSNP